MRLIILSPPDDYPDEPAVACRIIQLSSATFHLRKPGHTRERLVDYLEQIPAEHHRRIMVHGHPHLLDRFGLKGIHFTEKERTGNLRVIRRLGQVRPGCRFSSAFHRISDIPIYDGLFDYIVISPVFDSISKPGYRAAFDHAELKRFLSRTEHTVFALGGLNAQRVATAASLGFRGIAVLGAIWDAPVPEAAAVQLSAVCGGIQGSPVHETNGASAIRE
jgi:thiamine-phosphate pyrophosphorylase